jgi:hypothetical protein
MVIRERLRQALLLGTVAKTDRLNECGAALAKISGTDSLDLVELIMAVEEKGTKLDTVGGVRRTHHG